MPPPWFWWQSPDSRFRLWTVKLSWNVLCLPCSAFKNHDLGLRPLLLNIPCCERTRDEPMVVGAEEWHIRHPGRQAEIREDLVCSRLWKQFDDHSGHKPINLNQLSQSSARAFNGLTLGTTVLGPSSHCSCTVTAAARIVAVVFSNAAVEVKVFQKSSHSTVKRCKPQPTMEGRWGKYASDVWILLTCLHVAPMY